MPQFEWILCHLECRVFRRGAHRKLIHVGFTDQQSICLFKRFNYGRRKRGAVVLENLGRGCGLFPLHMDVIFDRNRYSSHGPHRLIVL